MSDDPGEGVERRRGGARGVGAFWGVILALAGRVLAGRVLGAAIVFALVGVAGGVSASAQEFIANGGVGGFPQALPGFEAPGVASGEFLLRSGVASGFAYDSNILRTQSNIRSDYIFFATPSFDLTRDGGKHVEQIIGSVTTAKYANSDTDDFTNAYLSASEMYEAAPGSQILVNASIADGYQRRVSSNYDIPSNAAEPVHQQILRGSVGYRKSWQHVDTGVTVTAAQQTYDNIRSTSGFIIDQSSHSGNDLSLDAFLNVRFSQRIHSNLSFSTSASDVRDERRNADLWRLADTITVNLTSKTSFGFLVAVSEQDYYNNPQSQVVPLGQYEAWLQWSPMQRLILTARGGYQDLGVNFERGYTGGGVGRYGSIDLSYLIRRDLQFVSGLRYDNAQLSGAQGVQDIIAGRAALTYELTQNVGLSFLYMLQKMDSSSTHFTSYDESVFQSSLNIRF